MKQNRVALAVVLVLWWLAGTVLAQGDSTLRVLEETDIPVRDAPELAERLGGVAGATGITVPPAPPYKVGDRQTFFVGNDDDETIFEVEAELAAATPGVYLWVEEGVAYDPQQLAEIAHLLDGTIFPRVRAFFGQEANPGIDGDPHIYVLNATNLGRGIGGYFNDSSTYPRQVVETSNEREMFVVAVDNVPFNSPAYAYVLAHEFVHMIQNNEDPNEETWVAEGTAELGAFLAVGPRNFAIEGYLADPRLQLNSWDIDNPGAYYGAASLFFTYLVDRFGAEFTRVHSLEPADGITGVQRALETLGVTDPQTGQPLTFDDVFADWLVANLLNDPRLGDGRFGYDLLTLGRRAALTAGHTSYPVSLPDQQVNQFSGNAILLGSEAPQTLRVTFQGQDTVRVVPTEAHSGTHFYWANRSDQSDARLTRAFDLRGVERATLHFWTWYEMEPFWDYGYISASTDGGLTWTVLETPNTTPQNPNSRAFAPGLTGYSGGGTETRPAPFLGVGFDPQTGVVSEVVAGSGAAEAGVQSGDELVAIDGEPLAPAGLVSTLYRYAVGDTIILTVARQGRELELPVTLGAHPQRVIPPTATWIEETLDLTPFAGNEVLVRFEYVTDQAFTRNGWVIDDISVPEIGYFDDAENGPGGWLAEGWVRIENALPQEFLVQVVEVGPTPTVTRWLVPGQGRRGQWTVSVGPETPAVLIISGMTPYTTQPAQFDLDIRPAP